MSPHKQRLRVCGARGSARPRRNAALGLGEGARGGRPPGEDSPFSAGPGSRKLHATLDVKQANDLLDKLGLAKGPDGMRMRTDGKGPLILTVITVGPAFVNFTRIAEMGAAHWLKNISLRATCEERERGRR